MKSILAIAALVCAMGPFARAADYATVYKEALNDYDNRGARDNAAQDCETKATAAAGLAADDSQRYDALVLSSKCIYFQGMKARTDDEKIPVFLRGKNVADKAKPLLKDRADAYYYYGINLGRWGLANGVIKSIGERHNLRKSMEAVIAKTGKEDDGRLVPGKEYEGYGANRTLGHMYFKLPGMFGGDNRLAEKLLREAVTNQSKDYPVALNTVYLAEVLVANGKKPEARKLLDELLQYEGKPEKYNPRRIPETIDEIADGKALRRDIGN
jgi:hypothetical protein